MENIISDNWRLADLSMKSRLIVGTARFPSVQTMLDSLEESETEMVTVALRRVSINKDENNLYNIFLKKGYKILPNTAGCFTVKDAVLTAELARESLGTSLIKLEVIADENTLFPDGENLLIAAKELVKLLVNVLVRQCKSPSKSPIGLNIDACAATPALFAIAGDIVAAKTFI